MNTHLNTKLISSLSSVMFMPSADIKAQTNITNATWYRIMQAPDSITVQHLLSIANGLHIPVRRFFSSGRVDVVGKREDYIADPYEPCYYDEFALQDAMSKNTDATWKKAAKAVAMSYPRLRNSMMAVTRTPVTRFLAVCLVFGIDPFTILVDPNPEPEKKAERKGRQNGMEYMRKETAALRKDLDELSAVVADLKDKYEKLMQAHANLLHRTNVNINTINGGHVGITADPCEPR